MLPISPLRQCVSTTSSSPFRSVFLTLAPSLGGDIVREIIAMGAAVMGATITGAAMTGAAMTGAAMTGAAITCTC
jgi:hypothetical protein